MKLLDIFYLYQINALKIYHKEEYLIIKCTKKNPE